MAPSVNTISAQFAAVGDPLKFGGEDFPAPEDGWVDLRIEGRYTATDAVASEDVSLTIPLERGEDGMLTWEEFGVYRIPFGRTGDQTGTFEGRVWGINRYYDSPDEGMEQAPESHMETSISVLPSLVVLDFRAFGETFIADCQEPAQQAIETVRYGFRVKAVGFDPLRFDFSISPGLIVGDTVKTSVTELSYPTDGNPEFGLVTSWSPVPNGTVGYSAGISVQADGADGIRRTLNYPINVRRPVEIYFQGPSEIAEIYPADPVSGCIPGGPGSMRTIYSETTSETRTRSVSRTLSQDWSNSYGDSHQETYGASSTQAHAETRSMMVTTADTTMEGGDTSESNLFSNSTGRNNATTVNFSNTDSEEIGARVGREEFRSNMAGGTLSTEASGSVSVPLVAEGTVKVGASASYARSWGSRDTREASANIGTAATRGLAGTSGETENETRARTYASGNNWGTSRTFSEANGFNSTESLSNTRSFGEALTTSQTVSESLGQSETEILTVSTTETESLSTQADVWAEHYGMWYRQTTRLVRFGRVVAYDLCGNGTEVGETVLNDWAWAAGLALGTECPPPTTLPDAECRLTPCGGQ